jgi:hypothetical protein
VLHGASQGPAWTMCRARILVLLTLVFSLVNIVVLLSRGGSSNLRYIRSYSGFLDPFSEASSSPIEGTQTAPLVPVVPDVPATSQTAALGTTQNVSNEGAQLGAILKACTYNSNCHSCNAPRLYTEV